MAKVTITALGGKLQSKAKPTTFNIKINDKLVEVKNFLPIEEKKALVDKICSQIVDGYNPVTEDMISVVEIVLAYTNISTTSENKARLYDFFVNETDIWERISDYDDALGKEIQDIEFYVREQMSNYVKYTQSAMGIIDAMRTKTDALSLDIDEISKQVSDPEVLGFVKDLIGKVNI